MPKVRIELTLDAYKATVLPLDYSGMVAEAGFEPATFRV